MKCPLCKDDEDYTLEKMEAHLIEAHDMDQDEREQFGGDFSHLVQAQIDLELRERITDRIKIARQAITTLRKDPKHWPTSAMMEKALRAYTRDPHGSSQIQMYPLSYGFYGLLDYIELGKHEKILDPTLRRAIENALYSEITQE